MPELPAAEPNAQPIDKTNDTALPVQSSAPSFVNAKIGNVAPQETAPTPPPQSDNAIPADTMPTPGKGGLGGIDMRGNAVPWTGGSGMKDFLPPDPEQKGFVENLGAHYLLNSAFASNLMNKNVQGDNIQGPPSTDYQGLAESMGITGVDSSRFRLVHNDKDFQSVMDNLQATYNAREIVGAGGWRSGAAGLVQGVIDPSNAALVIPVIGEEMLAARGLGAIAKTAIRAGEGAASNAAGSLANSLILQHTTQKEKTGEDVFNETRDTALIGGSLTAAGGLAHDLWTHPVTSTVRQAVGADVINNLRGIGGSASAAMAPIAERFPLGTVGDTLPAKATAKAFNATATVTSNPVNQIFSGTHTSSAFKGGVEALADVQNPLVERVTHFNDNELLPETTDALNARRLQHTQEAAPLFDPAVTPEDRQAGLDTLNAKYAEDEKAILAKDPNAYAPQETFKGAAVNVGGSIEGRSGLATKQIKVATNNIINDEFMKYRFGGETKLGNTRAALQDLMTRKDPAAPLTLSAFDEAIGVAMHQGDTHANEFVDAAAKKLRPLLDRVKQGAQEAGLLPEDLTGPDNAASYFPIQYDPIAVLHNPDRFAEIQHAALTRQQDQYREMQDAIRGHLDEIATLEQEHKKLIKQAQGREGTLENLALRQKMREGFVKQISDFTGRISELSNRAGELGNQTFQKEFSLSERGGNLEGTLSGPDADFLKNPENENLFKTLSEYVKSGQIPETEAQNIVTRFSGLSNALSQTNDFDKIVHLFDHYSNSFANRKISNAIPVEQRRNVILRDIKNHLANESRPEGRAKDKPLMADLQARGVKRRSSLARDLDSIGINPETHPALFKAKSGLHTLEDLTAGADSPHLYQFKLDEYGRLAYPDDFIDALDSELKGNPTVKTERMQQSETAAKDLSRTIDGLKEHFEASGIDPKEVTHKQIEDALVNLHTDKAGASESLNHLVENSFSGEENNFSMKDFLADTTPGQGEETQVRFKAQLQALLNNLDKFDPKVESLLTKFYNKIKEGKAKAEGQLSNVKFAQKDMRQLFDAVYRNEKFAAKHEVISRRRENAMHILSVSAKDQQTAKAAELEAHHGKINDTIGRISELRDNIEKIIGDVDPATVTRARRRTAEMLRDLQERRAATAEERAAAADERAPKEAGKIAERAKKTRDNALNEAGQRLAARSDRLKQAGKDDLTPEQKNTLIRQYLDTSERKAQGIEAKAQAAHDRISGQAEALRSGDKTIPLFDHEFEDLMKYIMQKRTDLSEPELRTIANDITNNIASQHQLIKGTGDYLDKPTTIAPLSQAEKPGALKARTLLPHVDDLIDGGFLNTKASEIIKNHTDSMIPFTEYTKFLNHTGDDYNLTNLQRKGREDYDLHRARATTPAELDAINKKNIADQDNLLTVRDRVLGKYGHPADPTAVFTYKIPNIVLKYNVLKLAGAVIGNAGDIAKISLTGDRAIRTGVQSLFTRLGKSGAAKELLTMDAEGLKSLGIITNVAMGKNSLYMQDVLRKTAQDRVTKGVDYTVNKVMALSYFAQFQDGIKTVYAQSLGHNVIRNVQMALEGKATANQLHILEDLGITAEHHAAIAEQYGRHGQNYGGTHYLNLSKWTDAEARDTLLLALNKDINRAFDERTANKSKFFEQNVWMRLLGQFKHFTISNTSTFLMRGLQERDMRFALTAVHMLGWGLAVEFIKNAQYGRPTDTSPTGLMVAAIDRSGLLGLPWEANNDMEKIFNVGVRPALGLGNAGGSKYKDVSNWSALFGPGYGTITSTASALRHGIHGQLDRRDVNFLAGMVPGSSLPWGPVELKGAAINAIAGKSPAQ